MEKRHSDYARERIFSNFVWLNSNPSINLCRVVSDENTFSSVLKGVQYKAIMGFFHAPSDNPFSFGSGYFIAFQSGYLQHPNSFAIVGFSLDATMENKIITLKEWIQNSNSSRVENRLQFKWHDDDGKYPVGLKITIDGSTNLLLLMKNLTKMEWHLSNSI